MKRAIQRTLEAIRKMGYDADICERWVNGARIRKDLFGWADIIAMDGRQIVAVQACMSGLRDHQRKMAGYHKTIARWIESGGRVELWFWRHVRKKRKYVAKVYAAVVESDNIIGWRLISDGSCGNREK